MSAGLTLRGGIVLPPIGFLNQNHDSPRWDFVDRPLVTTDIIPSTLSEVGFGVVGRAASRTLIFSYDVYLTNGLGDAIVGNAEGRTDIPSGKRAESFAEDNNGSPSISGRVALRAPARGEVGLSYYGGYYNTFELEGATVDDRRWLGIAAMDAGGTIGPAEVRAEVAYATIDVPAGLVELFGDAQWGAYLDIVTPLWRPRLTGYEQAVLSAGLRFERGTRARIPVGISLGIQSSPSKLVEEAEESVRAGYRKIKIKITPGADLEYLRAVREALGESAPLMADANSAYTLDDVEHLRGLDDLDLLMIEQHRRSRTPSSGSSSPIPCVPQEGTAGTSGL